MRQSVDLNACVTKLVPLLERIMGPRAPVETALDARLARVCAMPSLVDSLLLCLAMASRDTFAADVGLRIETVQGKLIDSRRPCAILSFQAGSSLDQGLASKSSKRSPDTRDLALVRTLVTSVGGDVQARAVGKTQRMEVTLPSLTDSDSAIDRAQDAKRILLVEDNEGVRDVLLRQLRKAGYFVVAVRDGEEGERAFKSDPSFDLLLSDIVVPGSIQGPALAERLLEQKAQLRVLYITGFAADGLDLRHRTLQKPISQMDLVHAVRQELSP